MNFKNQIDFLVLGVVITLQSYFNLFSLFLFSSFLFVIIPEARRFFFMVLRLMIEFLNIFRHAMDIDKSLLQPGTSSKFSRNKKLLIKLFIPGL